jgi:hypothetical protein
MIVCIRQISQQAGSNLVKRKTVWILIGCPVHAFQHSVAAMPGATETITLHVVTASILF